MNDYYGECNALSIDAMEDSFAICFGFMKDDKLAEYVMLQSKLIDGNPSKDSETYLELNDQSCSTYGGILKCELTTDSLAFTLSDTAAQELDDCPTQFSLKLSLDKSELDDLSSALSEVIFLNPGIFESIDS